MAMAEIPPGYYCSSVQQGAEEGIVPWDPTALGQQKAGVARSQTKETVLLSGVSIGSIKKDGRMVEIGMVWWLDKDTTL